MIGLTEKRQERLRYAVDTGSVPPAPQAASVGLRHFLIASGAVTIALSVFMAQASLGPAALPVSACEAGRDEERVECRPASQWTEPPSKARQEPASVSAGNDVKKRSFTPKSVGEASKIKSVPADTAGEPRLMQVALEGETGPLAASDTVTTGAISATPRPRDHKASPVAREVDGAMASKPQPRPRRGQSARPVDAGTRPPIEESGRRSQALKAEQPTKRPTLRQARLSAERAKTAETPRMNEKAKSVGNFKRVPEQAVASRPDEHRARPLAASPHLQRVLAAPIRGVTVCVYFVLCL
jgi:hypothetical protein